MARLVVTATISSWFKVFTGSSPLIKQLSSHIVRWFPAILVIIGSFAMVAGIFSTRALAVSPAELNISQHPAVYVGGGTCYTCHTDDFDGWSVPVELQAMAEASAKPKQLVADIGLQEDVQQLDAKEVADGCVENTGLHQSARSNSRQYIVRTDAGDALLPLDWSEQAPPWPGSGRDMTLEDNCAVWQSEYKSPSVKWTSQQSASYLARLQPTVPLRITYLHMLAHLRIFSETAFVEGQST